MGKEGEVASWVSTIIELWRPRHTLVFYLFTLENLHAKKSFWKAIPECRSLLSTASPVEGVRRDVAFVIIWDNLAMSLILMTCRFLVQPSSKGRRSFSMWRKLVQYRLNRNRMADLPKKYSTSVRLTSPVLKSPKATIGAQTSPTLNASVVDVKVYVGL